MDVFDRYCRNKGIFDIFLRYMLLKIETVLEMVFSFFDKVKDYFFQSIITTGFVESLICIFFPK